MEQINNKNVIKLLTNGAVGVLPTDTLYGLVCRANDQGAVAKLYKLKDRADKPGTIIAASIAQLVELGLKERYLKPVAHFWPNPISIVIPCGPELQYLHQGKFSLAVRLPKNKSLMGLLNQTGPLLTSSANQPGKSPVTTIQEAKKLFPDLDFYVDGGDLSGHPPSTVIRIVDDAVEVLREGAVTINEAGEIKKGKT